MRFNGKFHNKKKTTPDGEFDSTGEWQRWLFLKEAEKNGLIWDLQRQVKYILLPKQYRPKLERLKTKNKVVQRLVEREVTYTADFVYKRQVSPEAERDINDMFESQPDRIRAMKVHQLVVEDFKGFPNERWPLKKAMMLYFHNIEIREVKKPTEPI